MRFKSKDHYDICCFFDSGSILYSIFKDDSQFAFINFASPFLWAPQSVCCFQNNRLNKPEQRALTNIIRLNKHNYTNADQEPIYQSGLSKIQTSRDLAYVCFPALGTRSIFLARLLSRFIALSDFRLAICDFVTALCCSNM